MDVARVVLRAIFALIVFLTVVELRAGTADEDFTLAAGQYQASRWQEAHDGFMAFAKTHTADERCDRARFYAAESLVQLKQYVEAAKEFSDISESAKDAELVRKAHFRAGESSHLAGEREQAQRLLESFYKQYPSDPLNAYVLTYLGEVTLRTAPQQAPEWFVRSYEDFPDGPLVEDARFGEARAVEELKAYAEAAKKYAKIAARTDSPRAAEAAFRQGVCLHRSKQYDEAAKLLSQAVEKKIGGLEARYCLGLNQRAQSQYVLAATTFLTAANEDSTHALAPRLTYHAAEALLLADQPKQSLAEVERLLESWPDDDMVPSALVLAIQAAHDQGDAAAVDRYTATLEKRFPDHEQTKAAREHLALREVSRRDASVLAERQEIAETIGRNDIAEAASELSAFIDKHRQGEHVDWAKRMLAVCRLQLVERALKSGDNKLARDLLAKAIVGKPDESVQLWAMYLEGQLAIAEDRWADVNKSSERLLARLEHTPENPYAALAKFWLAESHYQLQEYDQSRAAFDELAKRKFEKTEPWMANIPLRLAQIAAVEKDWSRTIELATPIAKDFPKFKRQPEVDELLGRAHAAKADFMAAREAFRRVIDAPKMAGTEAAARCQWLIGETFFLQEDYSAAIREYLRVDVQYEHPTWQAAALFEAAKCYEQLGEASTAIELYARLLQNYPDSPLASEASRRLRTAQNVKTN